jgi:uncharacterized GH25 family protein
MKHWISACALLASLSAGAHEFWMVPDRFAPAPGTPVQLTLHVGEHFEGQAVEVSTSLVAALRHHGPNGATDLSSRLPAEPGQGAVVVTLANAGAQVLALDTHPNVLELGADKFHAYLREEGLDSIVQLRDASGGSAAPGRERYRRHVKTLLRMGGPSGPGWAVRTGQMLEIVPRADPQALRRGRDLGFQVLFAGRPLAGALVKAWHTRGEQLAVLRARTNASGEVAFALPWAGRWMVSLVHMVPVTDAAGIDWDSHWGNLTFEAQLQ